MPRKTFTDEFKQDAVSLFTEQRLPEANIARDLVVATVTLDNRIMQFSSGGKHSRASLEEEVKQLRQQLRVGLAGARHHKNATAFFAKQQS